MTLMILLLLGAGFVLIVSGAETDPATGNSVSITQTLRDIWTNNISLGQPPAQTQNVGPSTIHGLPTSQTFVGGAAGPAQYDSYRAAVVRAYLRSQRQ